MKNTPFSRLLASKGLTPKDAAAAGMPYGTVLAHCYGVRRMSLTTAKKYAEILGIPLDEIVSCAHAANSSFSLAENGGAEIADDASASI